MTSTVHRHKILVVLLTTISIMSFWMMLMLTVTTSTQAVPIKSNILTTTTNQQSTNILVDSSTSGPRARGFMDFARVVHGMLNLNRKSGFTISCNTCVFGLEIVKGMVDENRSTDDIVSVAKSLCVSLGIAVEDVCTGILNEVADEILYVFKNMNHSLENTCGFILGGACIKDTFLEEFDWQVNLTAEPPYIQPPLPEPNVPKLKILQISDVHLDRLYQEGSVANCNEELCCHALSVTPLENVTKAGKWGGAGLCDVPEILLDNLLSYITKNVEYDVVYWTGDIPAHDVWNQTKQGNLEDLRRTAQIFKKYFGDTPVYPCVGNHESEPVNSYPVPTAYKEFNVSYLYDVLVSTWEQLVPNLRNSSTVQRGGFYSTLVKPGLRLISLNMNYCNKLNWWLLLDSDDPTSEMQWLINELDQAEQNNEKARIQDENLTLELSLQGSNIEKVHIIGHIPPGNTDCTYVWSRNFHNVTLRYKNVITGQFYGHTHKDDYEIVYDNSNPRKPVAIHNVCPSVTTFDGVNPAFRLYTIDGVHENTTFGILDYDTYYMDLEKANEIGVPDWKVFYSALDSYGLNSFLPYEWDNLVKRMEKNDTLFETYRRNYYRDVDHGSCDSECKAEFLCSIRQGWSGAKC